MVVSIENEISYLQQFIDKKYPEMIVISVSKRWYHPRSEVRKHGKDGAKKIWFVFYFNEEDKLKSMI